MANILILAEHNGSKISPATRSAVTAAQKIGGDITLLVAGEGCSAAAQSAAGVAGVGRVLLAEAPHLAHQPAEDLATLLAQLAGEYSHIFAAATTFGKNILPRLAGLVDSQMISDITAVESTNTFQRPIYAGNAVATVESGDKTIVATVRPTAFDAAPAEGGNASVENMTPPTASGLCEFVSLEAANSDRPDLATAPIVVSGGRGLQSGENFKLLEDLAETLGGAAIGASRAAVDAGWVPNDLQVGQTGKVVAPKLYIAVGISGAIQHLAGMKDSKVIVAINRDENAPIFEMADYGLVADLFTAIPELIAELEKSRAAA